MASIDTINTVERLSRQAYAPGFVTDVPTDVLAKGLSEQVIREVSARKNEPDWVCAWRLKAYAHWRTMSPPRWCRIQPEIDFNDMSYFATPSSLREGPKSLDEVDPELLRTFEKLGVPVHERLALAGGPRQPVPSAQDGVGRSIPTDADGKPLVAVDAVFDSVSVATTYKKELQRHGVIFSSISEALHTHPELVRKYLGSVVPPTDNFYAALNSAVFTDGSFVFVPKGVTCPMELSTYFRINTPGVGQFERTLIVVEEGASVSYLEGCTAPMRDEFQLHAAVVELVALDEASIRYSTVQNWYAGDENGRGGVYNFVTKRGAARGRKSKISWTQVETGSAITWKYPSCILQGDESQGEFYSVAITHNHQVADTGTKMIHIGKNTRSRIVAKGIAAGQSDQTYRGLVKVARSARGARNFTQCDSLLIGDRCGAHTVPYIENNDAAAVLEHEATASKVSEDQIFYLQTRGLDPEKAVALVVSGFCREVLQHLPMEFAAEAQNLVALSLEGSVG